MAVLWETCIDGTHYQVRSAGRTRRLYTDGVCHSEFNPSRVTTGSVWDLLLLPAFLHGPGSVERALVLGVGGGTLLLQLRALAGTPDITGVDASAVHLDIARRFFGVDADSFKLVRSDARRWLRSCRGRFDLIVDDLFTGTRGEPVRAVEADLRWLELLASRLTEDGTLVLNFGSREEVDASGIREILAGGSGFAVAFRLSTVRLDNLIVALARRPCDPDRLRAHLEQQPVLARALRDRQLRYRLQMLDYDSGQRRKGARRGRKRRS